MSDLRRGPIRDEKGQVTAAGVQNAEDVGVAVRRSRARHLWLTFALALGLLLVAVSTAAAAQTRPYTGVSFGRDGASGGEPFGQVASIAVDESSGDVYVFDKSEKAIYKFNSAGEPISFTSTGSNFIHVQAEGAQIAVAPPDSIGGTEGDIYLASNENFLSSTLGVIAYAPSGEELGSFGPAGNGTRGVAVDARGHVFISGEHTYEYAPSSNPPTEKDFVQAAEPEPSLRLGNLAPLYVDGAGNIYGVEFHGENNPAYEFDGISDRRPKDLSFVANAFAVEPDGTVFADKGNEIEEYASAGSSSPVGIFGADQIYGSYEVAADSRTNDVYAFGSPGRIEIFGPPVAVPTVINGEVSFPIPTEAVVTGSVDPEGEAVTECEIEYGLRSGEYEHSAPCVSTPPVDSASHPIEAVLTGLEPEGTTYHYRLVVADAAGTAHTPDQTFATPSTVDTLEPEGISETTAMAVGRLFPDNKPYIACDFEYEPVSGEGSPATVECSPAAGEIDPDHQYHRVTGALTGLQVNHVSYRVRLIATSALGTIYGKWIRFTTSGEPLISGVRAFDADEDSAKVEATIDPGGFATTYAIEWGPSEAYGNTVAVGTLKASQGPTRITARIEGLTMGTGYHYRVVASNESAETLSLDREVETLDGCGLPQTRCFEVVSEREPGPVASPGHNISGGYLTAEPLALAAERPGALAYVSESGYTSATSGGELFYRAIRGAAGWSSTQLSIPITSGDETRSENSLTSRVLGMSPELGCGVVETNQAPLGTTLRMHEVLEAGGDNLYRQNENGSYTPITTLVPENLFPTAFKEKYEFHLAGMSDDCSRIYFASVFSYPGTDVKEDPALGRLPLYEWAEGRIQAVGWIPSGGSEVAAAASSGNDIDYRGNRADQNSVSKDGQRIFFTARRVTGSDPGEIGAPGLFARINGASTRDVSESETEVPDTEPRYQWATPDGSEVYFTAPAGLTAESNTSGTDLYAYDFRKAPAEHPLEDLSVDHLGGEADVIGMVGGSNDGSRVYFVANGRLVAGAGLTSEENREAGTYSLYLWEGGRVSFVATVKSSGGASLLVEKRSDTTAQTSPDGRYLLFESVPSDNEGGSAGLAEIYLFDADAPREAVTCISCVPGTRTVARGPRYEQLVQPQQVAEESFPPRSLVVTPSGPSVVFSSPDALAPGATEGATNLFMWSHGQVFLVDAEPIGLLTTSPREREDYPARNVFFLGTDGDGTDLYFSTPGALTREAGRGRWAVYDARVGGGFSQHPAPSNPCDPVKEGSCQGSSGAMSPVHGPPATSNFTGPTNRKPICTKNRVRRHDKCVKRQKKTKHRKRAKRSEKHGKRREKHRRNTRGKVRKPGDRRSSEYRRTDK